ncbi:hypothetical protein [Natronospora cellulosivora (SeqCode)]
MIRKSMDYEKKAFDLERIYIALKKIGDIESIKVEKSLGDREFEDLIFAILEDIMYIESPEKATKFVIRSSDDIIVMLKNEYSRFTGVSISANSRDTILKIKDILEEELDLVEYKDELLG